MAQIKEKVLTKKDLELLLRQLNVSPEVTYMGPIVANAKKLFTRILAGEDIVNDGVVMSLLNTYGSRVKDATPIKKVTYEELVDLLGYEFEIVEE